ncbi:MULTISPECIES: hypothetical protein [Pseudomonas]|uniref:hypothetical protein n=1 Tax=Pseudomonas TaxID=286 RepID=UPI003001F3A0
MNGMIESAVQRRITEQCAGLPRTALQLTTNITHQVVRIVHGQFVDLCSTERRAKRVSWDEWTNTEIWRQG